CQSNLVCKQPEILAVWAGTSAPVGLVASFFPALSGNSSETVSDNDEYSLTMQAGAQSECSKLDRLPRWETTIVRLVCPAFSTTAVTFGGLGNCSLPTANGQSCSFTCLARFTLQGSAPRCVNGTWHGE